MISPPLLSRGGTLLCERVDMKVVSDTELRVALLNGIIIILGANEVKEVPEEVGVAALAMGAKQVLDEDSKEEAVVVEEPSEEDELVAKLVALMEEGDPDNFKKDGTPRAPVVSALAGRSVSTEERETLWEIALRKS